MDVHGWSFFSLGMPLVNSNELRHSGIKTESVEGMMGWRIDMKDLRMPVCVLCVHVCGSSPPAQTLEGSAAKISMQDFLMIWRRYEKKREGTLFSHIH